jgi:trimeric autotransporter adhesin
MRSLHRVPVLVLLCSVLAFSARAGDAILLSDISTGFAGASSSPFNFVDVGGKCFFSATDGTNGVELYVSDGFSSGTGLVKDIFSGPGSSSPSNLINVGGTLFFTANDGATGTELWKSDGTSGGTVQVRDIRVGPGSSSPSSLILLGGVLYFSADDGINGRELWKTDGTSAGTVQVKDINTAAAGSSLATNTRIVVMNGNLYFPANDGTNGIELWKSDGSDAGTVLVKNIHTTAGSSSLNNNNEIVVLGAQIIFPATDATNGRELWKSDGTDAGTLLIQNLNSGTGNANPDQLTVAGGFVYFRATAGSILGSDTELYRTTGTGTTLFNLNVQTSGLVTVSSSPQQLTAVGTDLFCRALVNTGANAGTSIGNELVRITAGGVRTDYDIAAGTAGVQCHERLRHGDAAFDQQRQWKRQPRQHPHVRCHARDLHRQHRGHRV